MNKLIYALPLLVCVLIIGLGALKKHKQSTPQYIEKTVPYFEYPEILNSSGENGTISLKNLPKKPIMINIFGSWCATCKLEHEQLMTLSDMGVIDIYGIAFKDTQDDVEKMVKKIGNPFTRIALDKDMKTIPFWGVRETPQSYIIDSDGVILYHHRGPISAKRLQTHILPAIQKVLSK